MAKITVCGDAVVITSALKLDDIKLVQKYRKQALTLFGDDMDSDDFGSPVFKIAATDSSCGHINKYGAEFSSQTRDEEGLAVITVVGKIPADTDVKEFIADTIGQYVATLNRLEATLPDVIQVIKAERQAIVDSIVLA